MVFLNLVVSAVLAALCYVVGFREGVNRGKVIMRLEESNERWLKEWSQRNR